ALQRIPEARHGNRLARKHRRRRRRRRRSGLRENLRFPLRSPGIGGSVGVLRSGWLLSALRLVLRRLRGGGLGLCLARVGGTASRLLRGRRRDYAHQRECDGRCDRCFLELHGLSPLTGIHIQNEDTHCLWLAYDWLTSGSRSMPLYYHLAYMDYQSLTIAVTMLQQRN